MLLSQLILVGIVTNAGLDGSLVESSVPKPQPKLSPEVQQLCDDYFAWRMTDMPEFATFVGIHDYDDRLDNMSIAAYDARYSQVVSYLGQAEALLPTLTIDSDIINIQSLIDELTTFSDGYQYKGFYAPMNYMEGLHTDFERLLNWMLLNTEADYGNMISRIIAVDTQVTQIISLMQEGMNIGVVNHAYSMKGLPDALDVYIVVDPEMSRIYTQFFTNFSESFTALQVLSIQTQAKDAISQYMVPAFTRLRDFVQNDYVTRPNYAVTSIPNGDNFYNQLIAFHTSTTKNASEIHQIGLGEVDKIEADMIDVIIGMGYNMTIQEFSDMIRNDSNNYYGTPEELLAGFENLCYSVIPPHLPDIFKNIPTTPLDIRPLPNPDGPSAFYLSGSYDSSRPGVFYVNTAAYQTQPKYGMMTLSLHEGNPGHHLQGSHNIESPTYPFFRRIMEDRMYGISPSRFPMYSFYAEGWALYSEGLGFDMNLYDDDLDRYGHYSDEIFRACRLVVDTGIHALGWTKEQAIDYMYSHTAMAREEVENEVDRYITWPGQALAYKMGELRISEMRNDAELRLGALFNVKDFHDVVLESYGSMDLVESEVNKWINSVLSNSTVSVAG